MTSFYSVSFLSFQLSQTVFSGTVRNLSLPCGGSVHTSLTWPHASLDQILDFLDSYRACPWPTGTWSSSSPSRRTLLGHLWCKWPELRVDCIGPRGARTLFPLKALGLGGHCSVHVQNLPDFALTEELGLAEQRALFCGWYAASPKP